MSKTISPYELNENCFQLIDKDWMLITAKNPETGAVNTMTASWGGMGILWNKPVAFVFIRPQRYTLEFVHAAEGLTLSFFASEYKDALRLCGCVSGRDCDKIKDAGLHTEALSDTAVSFSEARLVLTCRKLYEDTLKECAFLDKSLLANYAQGDYHHVIICEINEVLQK